MSDSHYRGELGSFPGASDHCHVTVDAYIMHLLVIFTHQQVCVYVRLRAHNHTATVRYCALTSILKKIGFGGKLSKVLRSRDPTYQ